MSRGKSIQDPWRDEHGHVVIDRNCHVEAAHVTFKECEKLESPTHPLRRNQAAESMSVLDIQDPAAGRQIGAHDSEKDLGRNHHQHEV